MYQNLYIIDNHMTNKVSATGLNSTTSSNQGHYLSAVGKKPKSTPNTLLGYIIAAVFLISLASLTCWIKTKLNRFETTLRTRQDDTSRLARRPLPEVANKAPKRRLKKRLANAIRRVSRHVYEEISETIPACVNAKPVVKYTNLKFSDVRRMNRRSLPWYASLRTIAGTDATLKSFSSVPSDWV